MLFSNLYLHPNDRVAPRLHVMWIKILYRKFPRFWSLFNLAGTFTVLLWICVVEMKPSANWYLVNSRCRDIVKYRDRDSYYVMHVKMHRVSTACIMHIIMHNIYAMYHAHHNAQSVYGMHHTPHDAQSAYGMHIRIVLLCSNVTGVTAYLCVQLRLFVANGPLNICSLGDVIHQKPYNYIFIWWHENKLL